MACNPHRVVSVFKALGHLQLLPVHCSVALHQTQSENAHEENSLQATLRGYHGPKDICFP